MIKNIGLAKVFVFTCLALVLFAPSAFSAMGQTYTGTPTICRLALYKIELGRDDGSFFTLWENAKGRKIDFASVNPGDSILSVLMPKRLTPGNYTILRLTTGQTLEICGRTTIGYTDSALTGITYTLPNAYPLNAFFSRPTSAGGAPSIIKVPVAGGPLVIINESLENLGTKTRFSKTINPLKVGVNDNPQLRINLNIKNKLQMMQYTDPRTKKVYLPSFLQPVEITFSTN